MTTATKASLYPSSPGVSRFNAWFFDVFDGLINASLARIKNEVYRDLPDEIVEIGPGVGGNFRYYEPGTTVVAIEPNSSMHARLRKNADKAGIDLVLHDTLAEDTGLPAESAQVVVSNLVLCTVTDPAAALAEAWRVLRPQGRLLIVEHVRGRGPMLKLLQFLVRSPWKWMFEGCELGRDTLSEVRQAGFDVDRVTERPYLTLFLPINFFAYGEARK